MDKCKPRACRLHPVAPTEGPREDTRLSTSQGLPPGQKIGKLRPWRLKEAGHRVSGLGPLPWPASTTHLQDLMAEGEVKKEEERGPLGPWGVWWGLPDLPLPVHVA